MAAEAYFDAAVTLLFFLLIGRFLDQRMRERARSAVAGIARLAAKGATRIVDGRLVYVPIDEVRPGMLLRVNAGERMPVDARIASGASELDRSLVTGESEPVAVKPGSRAEAGTLNLSGSLDVEALTGAEDSYLAEIMRMMEAAESGRGAYVRIADRMARLYAPVVHVLAAATFLGWLLVTGGDWYQAAYAAIAVLIITCPCAIGLAVPVVHVIGAWRLFEAGILMKDGSALERLADVDSVVFDKTGTLTTGMPKVAWSDLREDHDRAVVRALAARSSHPASRAVLAWLGDGATAGLERVREVPGSGIEAQADGRSVRLGRPAWVAEIASTDETVPPGAPPSPSRAGERPVSGCARRSAKAHAKRLASFTRPAWRWSSSPATRRSRCARWPVTSACPTWASRRRRRPRSPASANFRRPEPAC